MMILCLAFSNLLSNVWYLFKYAIAASFFGAEEKKMSFLIHILFLEEE